MDGVEMKNKYEIRGGITAIIINSPKYGRLETLINTNKLKKANEFSGTWGVVYSKSARSFYVQGNEPMVNGRRGAVQLHRWVTDAPSNLVCDHFDSNTLNNTDKNLRLITQAENMQNRKAQHNSFSGIRGVYWYKQTKKWNAQVGKKNIGYFDDIEDARKAVESARSEMMPYSKEAYRNAN